MIKMASVEKFTASAVVNQLRHIERTIAHPANDDIDPRRMHLNYQLSPDRGMTSYDYYKQRLSELYCYKRDDVVTLSGWVVTAPADLPPEQHEQFFRSVYDFLAHRYGEENVISAVVHNDESGEPHLHFDFIPAVPDKKHGGYKVCANDILTRRELRNFHPDMQRHLDNAGLSHAKVHTGVTARQGGNRTVRELKQKRQHQYEQHQYERGLF